MEIYTCRSKDSLYSIARRFNTEAAELARINELSSPQPLPEGLSLLIPGKSAQIRRSTQLFLFSSNRLCEGPVAEISPCLSAFVSDSGLIMPEGKLAPASFAQAKQLSSLAVLPILSVSNKSDTGFDSGCANKLLQDSSRRSAFCDQAVEALENGGFGALCLQLCYLREFDRDSLNLLLEELCSRLHRQGKYLMFSAPAKLSDSDSSPACAGLDFEALGYFCDKVLLRCYDWAHGGTAPQSPAPLPLVRQGLEYALKFIPSWKLLLGISDHGYRWHLPWRQGDGADAVSHRIAQATAISNAVPIRFDRLSQTPFFSFDPSCSQRCIICYDDAASLKLKLELIKEYDLAGAALYSDSRPDFRLLYMMQEMFNPEKFM